MKKSYIVLILAFLAEIYFVYYWWKNPSQFIYAPALLIYNTVVIIRLIRNIKVERACQYIKKQASEKNQKETNCELE